MTTPDHATPYGVKVTYRNPARREGKSFAFTIEIEHERNKKGGKTVLACSLARLLTVARRRPSYAHCLTVSQRLHAGSVLGPGTSRLLDFSGRIWICWPQAVIVSEGTKRRTGVWPSPRSMGWLGQE